MKKIGTDLTVERVEVTISPERNRPGVIRFYLTTPFYFIDANFQSPHQLSKGGLYYLGEEEISWIRAISDEELEAFIPLLDELTPIELD